MQIENVSYSVGQTQIIDDVTLQIPKGQVTALIGPNGAGKSTLLSLMARLIRPQSGKVMLDGDDLQTTAPQQLAKKLSVLRQENVISSRLTVRDLISFGRYPHHKGRSTADDLRHVEIAINALDLDDLAHRFLDELSGGQKQRALIAMILCQGTDHVLLDEPLNNLDLVHARQLMQSIFTASRMHARTTVIVLHDINYASQYADHIVGMKAGRILFQGPTSEVFNSDQLSALFGTEVPVHDLSGRQVSMHY